MVDARELLLAVVLALVLPARALLVPRPPSLAAIASALLLRFLNDGVADFRGNDALRLALGVPDAAGTPHAAAGAALDGRASPFALPF